MTSQNHAIRTIVQTLRQQADDFAMRADAGRAVAQANLDQIQAMSAALKPKSQVDPDSVAEVDAQLQAMRLGIAFHSLAIATIMHSQAMSQRTLLALVDHLVTRVEVLELRAESPSNVAARA